MKSWNESLLELSHHIPVYLWNAFILVIAVVIGNLIKWAIFKAVAYYKARQGFSFLKSVITHMGKPLSFFLSLVCFYLLIPFLRVSEFWLSAINKMVEISFIAIFAYLLINLIRVVQDFIIHTYILQKDDNLRERKIMTQLQFIRKFFMAFIILLAVAAILFSFDGMRKIGAGLLTSVGIGGIIIGFAAQKSLGNLLAGFQIAFTQPIRIDDVLVVEGEWGKVEEITLTYVVVAIWDQRRLILPINYFIEKPFQNWTRISSDILGTVFIYTDYNVPVDALREEFERLLASTPLWDKRVQVIRVTDAKEGTVEIRALMSSSNSSKNFDLRCFIREKLIDFIKNHYPESLPRTRAEIFNFTDESRDDKENENNPTKINV
mgnify:CR=1 FL=1